MAKSRNRETQDDATIPLEETNKPAAPYFLVEAVGVQKWIVVQEKASGEKRYAGRSMHWQLQPTHITTFFVSEDEAIEVLDRYLDDLQRLMNATQYAIEEVKLNVPLAASEDESTLPQKVNVQLDIHQTRNVVALRRALRQLNVELRPGYPVDSNADAVRWILATLRRNT